MPKQSIDSARRSDHAAAAHWEIPGAAAGLDASRDFWDEKARENPYWYVSSFGPYEDRNLDEFWESGVKIWAELKRALGYQPQPADVVVEIGCGVGRLTRAITPEVAHVDALDISAEMLAAAGKMPARNVSFHLANGDNLQELPDGRAQLVLAYCVFQHLPSEQVLARYLEEMVRVAKPGGIIAFTMTPRTWHVFLRPLFQARRWLIERFVNRGPRDLYRHAWLGIRPSHARIQTASSVPLKCILLHRDKWLFCGKRCA